MFGAASADGMSRREPGDAAPPPVLEYRLLVALGVPSGFLDAAWEADPGGPLAQAAMARGLVHPDDWWPALANVLGLAFRRHVIAAPPLPGQTALRDLADFDRRIETVWLAEGEGAQIAMAPVGPAIPRLEGYLAQHPALRDRIVLAPSGTLREAVRRSMADLVTHEARTGLARRFPALSASRPPPAPAVTLLGTVLAVAPLLILYANFWVELAFLAICLVFGVLRLLAATDFAPVPESSPLSDADLPTYAVLVPLYHEAALVPGLAEGLARLDYPRHLLDVKVLVEADDAATVAMAEGWARAGGWDVIRVPPSLPRTKPKALAVGLLYVDAELVTVFDAEDRPDPDQLRRAAAAFAGRDGLVCIQATLVAEPAPGGGWISRQFAAEYRMLFGGLLPWLARRGAWFPLGGTSNHFRRATLVAVGGWDPCNVTEDADIAVRLARAGGAIGMVASRTREEAPSRRSVWTAQRARWLKGWMQTLFVHLRHPVTLWRDLGTRGFGLFVLFLAGQFVSAVIFPASALAVLLVLSGIRPLMAERPFLDDIQLVACLLAFGLNWIAAGALLVATRGRRSWPGTILDIATLPLYWLMLFPAALRAIRELATSPFSWNKTPHGPDQLATPLHGEPLPGYQEDRRV